MSQAYCRAKTALQMPAAWAYVFMCTFAVIALSAAAEELRVTAEADFQMGQFAVTVSDSAKADANATDRVLQFAEMLRSHRAWCDAGRKVTGQEQFDSVAPKSYWDAYRRAMALINLELCNQTAGSQANWTAVLLMGAAARSWSGEAVKPVMDALQELCTRAQGRWESYYAVLLKCQLLIHKDTGTPISARYEQAIDLLEKHTPPAEFNLDQTEPLVQVMVREFPVQLPLRASFLVMRGMIEYDAAISIAPSDGKWLDRASATCEQIIQEFPDAKEHVKWAKDLRENQIPALKRELGFEEKTTPTNTRETIKAKPANERTREGLPSR